MVRNKVLQCFLSHSLKWACIGNLSLIYDQRSLPVASPLSAEGTKQCQRRDFICFPDAYGDDRLCSLGCHIA